MAQIKAVIFDMDGVLIDAKDWHYEALNRALGLFGLEISRYDHLVTYDGLPTKSKLKMISMERGLPEKLHDFINQLKQRYTMEITYARCKPVFYHQYALSRLKYEGYRIVVCSNSIRRTIEVMMEQAGLTEYLDFFLSNQDVSRPKPDPEMYTLALQRLGLLPEECLIVEDNDHGIKAAIASGAHVLQVGGVEEVTYQHIMERIATFEGELC